MCVFLRWSFCAVLLGLVALAWVPDGSPGRAAVMTYPSSQSIAPSGQPPRGGGRELVYHVAIGEREGALLVVRGARKIAVAGAGPRIGEISVRLFFGHFVAAGGRLVPDALEPWDGIERGTEKANQPVLVQIE